MQLIFGKGDILVTECGTSDHRHILMEMGRGAGVVAAKNVQCSDRLEGAEITPEDLENATCTLTFDNPASVAVVLHKLMLSMVHLKRAGKTLSSDNSDHVEIANEMLDMWAEITNQGDGDGTCDICAVAPAAPTMVCAGCRDKLAE